LSNLIVYNGSGYASSLTRYAVRYDRYSHCYLLCFSSLSSFAFTF